VHVFAGDSGKGSDYAVSAVVEEAQSCAQICADTRPSPHGQVNQGLGRSRLCRNVEARIWLSLVSNHMTLDKTNILCISEKWGFWSIRRVPDSKYVCQAKREIIRIERDAVDVCHLGMPNCGYAKTAPT
jgi:hypothetical protein